MSEHLVSQDGGHIVLEQTYFGYTFDLNGLQLPH